jgi:hypothetical protein
MSIDYEKLNALIAEYVYKHNKTSSIRITSVKEISKFVYDREEYFCIRLKSQFSISNEYMSIKTMAFVDKDSPLRMEVHNSFILSQRFIIENGVI